MCQSIFFKYLHNKIIWNKFEKKISLKIIDICKHCGTKDTGIPMEFFVKAILESVKTSSGVEVFGRLTKAIDKQRLYESLMTFVNTLKDYQIPLDMDESKTAMFIDMVVECTDHIRMEDDVKILMTLMFSNTCDGYYLYSEEIIMEEEVIEDFLKALVELDLELIKKISVKKMYEFITYTLIKNFDKIVFFTKNMREHLIHCGKGKFDALFDLVCGSCEFFYNEQIEDFKNDDHNSYCENYCMNIAIYCELNDLIYFMLMSSEKNNHPKYKIKQVNLTRYGIHHVRIDHLDSLNNNTYINNFSVTNEINKFKNKMLKMKHESESSILGKRKRS